MDSRKSGTLSRSRSRRAAELFLYSVHRRPLNHACDCSSLLTFLFSFCQFPRGAVPLRGVNQARNNITFSLSPEFLDKLLSQIAAKFISRYLDISVTSLISRVTRLSENTFAFVINCRRSRFLVLRRTPFPRAFRFRSQLQMRVDIFRMTRICVLIILENIHLMPQCPAGFLLCGMT